jgi:ABC-type multidrug transport system fused ATPase/permease subunit
MTVGATFLDLLWIMIIAFFWLSYLMILFQVIGDVFRRDGTPGMKKALWIAFLLVFPLVGLLAYVITNGAGMATRQAQAAQRAQAEVDTYIREVAGGSADQIAKAKALLDAGTISQDEYEKLKAKALA